MLAADSSYFLSPTVAAMGACPLIRTNTPGSRWRYTLPSQAVSGHASPAFNDACGTLTFCAPPYAAAPWRPCPAAARFGFCETRSGPGFFSPVAMPARASTWAVFSVLAGHNNSRSVARVVPASPATRSHNPACGSRRATFHSHLPPAPAEPAPTMPPVLRSRHPTVGRPLAAEASCFYSLQ